MAEKLVLQPDARFIQEAIANGGEFKQCMQCATCSSTCSLSTEENPFPRRPMLLAQLGMERELLQDPSPWLCFYCGDCSKSCPRQANPAESMMALRRYLTTRYDWTGVSRFMYRSAWAELGVLALVAAFMVALFTLPQSFGFGLLARSTPEARNVVMLDKFAPTMVVHHGDAILASLLSFFLLTNAARMFIFLTRGKRAPLRVYLAQLPEFLIQAVTQIRWKQCEDKNAITNWVRHLFLVTGYGTIFTLVVIFLPWFQVEDSSFHWTSLLGYYSTVVLIAATLWILIDRMGKRTEMHRFSHLSDWLFPILLFLTAVTGIAVNILRLENLAMPTYILYTVHMAIAVPMLIVEVPFGKWAHLLYRPIAIYVAAVNRKEFAASGQQAAMAAQAVDPA
ncbi:MAG: 4Fe-4S dicluster domain-containing protein [Candidatus Korobacteraceae bacterium]